MTATLEAAGHHLLYDENTEGGHTGPRDNAQAAVTTAMLYDFLLQTLSGNSHGQL